VSRKLLPQRSQRVRNGWKPDIRTRLLRELSGCFCTTHTAMRKYLIVYIARPQDTNLTTATTTVIYTLIPNALVTGREDMRAIVLALGFLVLVPLRCATADDNLLDKYLRRYYPAAGECTQTIIENCARSYNRCRNLKPTDRSFVYNCCLQWQSCVFFCNPQGQCQM
jgi:hypothetical protein